MRQSKKRTRATLPASFYEQLEANKRLNFNINSHERRKSCNINVVGLLDVRENINPILTPPRALTSVSTQSLETVELLQENGNSNRSPSSILVICCFNKNPVLLFAYLDVMRSPSKPVSKNQRLNLFRHNFSMEIPRHQIEYAPSVLKH
jgi:hypothetical protein